MNNLTNVTTGEVRLSYVHLFKPHAFQAGQEEKYGCTVLVSKSDTDTMNRIHAAIEAAKQRGITEKWNGQCPPMIPTPMNDGDGVRPSDGMPYGPECKGHWVFTASNTLDYPPNVIDAQGNPMINQSEVYSGMYAKVNVIFFPYTFGGKKGIGCRLYHVMKTRDGEPLAGSAPTVAQAFGLPQTAPAQAGYTQPGAAYGQPAQGYQPSGAAYGQLAQGYQQPASAGYQQPAQGYQQPAPAAPGAVNPVTGLPFI